jgi:uncharacterized protein YjiS (DUF1127 family)
MFARVQLSQRQGVRARRRLIMSENEHGNLRSFYEIECSARRERSVILAAWLRDMAHKCAKWIRELAREGVRLARRRIAEQRRQSAIRVLHSLDDRILADMGISRGEIEFVVRNGRPFSAAGLLRRWHRVVDHVPARKKAA